jgi:hypothetical protein
VRCIEFEVRVSCNEIPTCKRYGLSLTWLMEVGYLDGRQVGDKLKRNACDCSGGPHGVHRCSLSLRILMIIKYPVNHKQCVQRRFHFTQS